MTTPPNQDMQLYSQEAEEATLGALMIDPSLFDLVRAHVPVPEAFFLVRHQYIWRGMLALRNEGVPIDPLVLADRLEKFESSKDILELVGGRAYLIKLTNSMGTSVHAEVYASLVGRAYHTRTKLKALDDMKATLMDVSKPLPERIAQAEKLWQDSDVAQDSSNGAWLEDTLGDLYEDVSLAMQNRLDGKPMQNVIPTCYTDLDALLGGGVEPQNLIIVSGVVGVGKSAWLDNMILNILLHWHKQGLTHSITYFTTERSKYEVARRLTSIATRVTELKVRTGAMNAQEAKRWVKVIGDLSNYRLYVDDTPGITPHEVEAISRRQIRRYGCKLVVWDGIYEANTGIAELDKSTNKHAKFSYLAKETKRMAQRLDVPVYATHQLSRAIFSRANKRPQLSDLRESGDIEAAADKVFFVHDETVFDETLQNLDNSSEVIVAKNRNGAKGAIKLYWDNSLTLFSNATTIDLTDVKNSIYGD